MTDRVKDRLALLHRLRDRLYSEVMNPDCPSRDLGPLARRWQDIMNDVDALEKQLSDESGIDDFLLRIKGRISMLHKVSVVISDALETCPNRELALLTRRLQDIMKEIDRLEEQVDQEGLRVDGDGTVVSDQQWTPDEL